MALARPPKVANGYEARIAKIAMEMGAIVSSWQTTDHEIGVSFDDSPYLPHTPTEKEAKDMKLRFVDRLAAVFCGLDVWKSGVKVMMKEDEKTQSVKIWVVPCEYGTQHQSQVASTILAEMGRCLSVINNPSKSSQIPLHLRERLPEMLCYILLTHTENDLAVTRRAREAVWENILKAYRSRLFKYARRLRKVFEDHKKSFEDLVTKLFGVLEDDLSAQDHNLGQHIVELNQVCAIPAKEMTRENYEDIIYRSTQAIRQQHLYSRLRLLLGDGGFASELLGSVKPLARPQRAYETVVRAARSLSTFATVSIYRGLPISLPEVAHLPNSKKPNVSTTS